MAINSKDFIPRPGFVNKQGCLPDPIELCCIQVPKIFDQGLIKRCLKPIDRSGNLNPELCQALQYSDGTYVDDISKVKKVGCCHNFNVEITSVSNSCIKGEEGYKRVTINFKLTFEVDVMLLKSDGTCENRTVDYTVNQTITIPKFYCPDPIAQISTNIGSLCNPQVEDEDKRMIKLEVVADCLKSDLVLVDCPPPATGKAVFLCVTVGMFIIVKSELLVQLLIPCYGYCPTPAEFPDEIDPCTEFKGRVVPDFYPPQKMDNLFPDLTEDCFNNID